MLWEGKPLREIQLTDIQSLLQSGLEEHLQLEYKSELYEDTHRGRLEFLQDVCMFANTSGGILLIGISERRDSQGQPTGAPDGAREVGLELQNPDAVLRTYDARVMEAIEERLPLESVPIDVGRGRYLLAIRVPNSTRKPHSVTKEGHIYFPARRERQRYHLSVREIKELVMRSASRLQQSEEILKDSFSKVVREDDSPYLMIGMIPAFFEDYLIDVRNGSVSESVGFYSRTATRLYIAPTYNFDGIQRREPSHDFTVQFWRNGLLRSSQQLPLITTGSHSFYPTAIDVLLRRFIGNASAIYRAASINPPFVLGMRLSIQRPLAAVYSAGVDHLVLAEQATDAILPGEYIFPYQQIEGFYSADRIIHPLCDQAHQMFGREGSPSFNTEGEWIAQYQ
jgi:hypothetical protein